MTDPATCGPVCLALPQDVQAMAFDCPASFLRPAPLRIRRPAPDARELATATELLCAAKRPLVVAGGGVLYSRAAATLAAWATAHGVPVAETQAGKGALAWDHALNVGAIGVTGSPAANALAVEADLVIAIGTRLQDFTTGSHTLFAKAKLLSINVQAFDAAKWGGAAVVADARVVMAALRPGAWRADAAWTARATQLAAQWRERVTQLTTAPVKQGELPYDAEVIGAVRDSAADSAANDIVVCAAGTLPAELHKLWRTSQPGGYHVEYGYSCMGYEIAGGLGVKLAQPEREVVVMVGDGSYLMLNSEIATSVMLKLKLIVVVLDNRGYGCIQRLQIASGSPRFNNLLEDCGALVPIDFAAHAASLGATAVHVKDVAELKSAMRAARAAPTTQVIVIDTTPWRTTDDGGTWWEVAIPEVSPRAEVRMARRTVRGWNNRGNGHDLERAHRRQPALLDERRPAVARRRDAARNGARRRQGDRLRRLRARQQVSEGRAGAEGQARSVRSGLRLGLVLRRAGARHAWKTRSERCHAHMDKLRFNSAKVVVYGEVADTVQGQIDTPLDRRPRFADDAQWKAYAERLNAFGAHLKATYGITLAYHHHMGAYVESPDDIDRLMALTDPACVGLLFDTGHAYYGGATDPNALLAKHVQRVVHVHCKDVRPALIAKARNDGWSFLTACSPAPSPFRATA